MISKFLSILFWIAVNFALPAFLFIIGINIFLDGAGIKFHVDHNSLTYLGLMLIRAGLPVTPPSPRINMLPLKRMDANDPFMKELEKALKEELARQDNEDKKDDGSSGPSTPGS